MYTPYHLGRILEFEASSFLLLKNKLFKYFWKKLGRNSQNRRSYDFFKFWGPRSVFLHEKWALRSVKGEEKSLSREPYSDIKNDINNKDAY